MSAIQSSQNPWARRLHSERHTGEPGHGQLLQPLRGDRVRISLSRNLDVRSEPPRPLDRLQHADEFRDRHQSGRSATKKYRRNRSIRQTALTHRASRKLDLQINILRILSARTTTAQLSGRIRVEITVTATHSTKRDMNVNPKWAVLRAR